MTKLILLCALLFGFHTLADDEVDAESLKALEGMENPVQKSASGKAAEAITPQYQQEQIQDVAHKSEQNIPMNNTRY